MQVKLYAVNNAANPQMEKDRPAARRFHAFIFL